MNPFPQGGLALIIGAQGGIGQALTSRADQLGHFTQTIGLSRHSSPPLDLLNEASIAEAAAHIGQHLKQHEQALRAVIVATGFLHGPTGQPEKSWQQLNAAHMAHSFAVNVIGPALLAKHFLPLLPSDGKAVFAVLSAKVGSIGDNHLGGWYSYRAAKAALNQVVRTASVELKRKKPQALCVAMHPGTVNTGLSAPFAKTGLQVQSPDEAAAALWATLGRLDASSSGQFLNQHGDVLPW